MQVRACHASCVPHETHDLPSLYGIAFFYEDMA